MDDGNFLRECNFGVRLGSECGSFASLRKAEWDTSTLEEF